MISLGRALALMTAAATAACTTIGPTVHVEAGPNKSDVAWSDDQRGCKAQTDAAVQPMANGLNANLNRSADDVRADNGRIQVAYDEHYARCMVDRGNTVAGLAPATTPAPGPDDAVGQAQEAMDLSPPMRTFRWNGRAYAQAADRDCQ